MNTWQREALSHAKTEYPKESCGLVIEKNGSQQYYPCNNIEIDGVNSFTIDPEDWAKAEDTGKILHICHSHPNGDLRASELDIENCNNIGLSWFIFAELLPKLKLPGKISAKVFGAVDSKTGVLFKKTSFNPMT